LRLQIGLAAECRRILRTTTNNNNNNNNNHHNKGCIYM